MTSAINAQVRELARVLILTGGLTIDVIGPEDAARVLCRVYGVQGANLYITKRHDQYKKVRKTRMKVVGEEFRTRARTMASTPTWLPM